MLTIEQHEALGRIAEAAARAELQTGCPAELSAAQCILESGWLQRCPGNNCFGIKATSGHSTYQFTKEYENGQPETVRAAFGTYPTLADCFTAHARLIQQGRYSEAWRAYEADPQHRLDGLIRGIASIYATDPNYAAKVIELAHSPHVAAAVQYWREKAAA